MDLRWSNDGVSTEEEGRWIGGKWELQGTWNGFTTDSERTYNGPETEV